MIGFSPSLSNKNFDPFIALYSEGRSLRAISQETGHAKTTIRKHLIKNGVPLRASSKANERDPQRPQRAFYGRAPYGFEVFDGRLVADPKETKVVRRIMALHKEGMSFNSIAKLLTKEKVPSKVGSKWNDVTVGAIVKRTKAKGNDV